MSLLNFRLFVFFKQKLVVDLSMRIMRRLFRVVLAKNLCFVLFLSVRSTELVLRSMF